MVHVRGVTACVVLGYQNALALITIANYINCVHYMESTPISYIAIPILVIIMSIRIHCSAIYSNSVAMYMLGGRLDQILTWECRVICQLMLSSDSQVVYDLWQPHSLTEDQSKWKPLIV